MNLTEARAELQQKIVTAGQPLKPDTLDLTSLGTVLNLLPDGPELVLTEPQLHDLPATQNRGPSLQLSGTAKIIGISGATANLTLVTSENELVPAISCTLPPTAEVALPDEKIKLLSVKSVSFEAHADGSAVVSGEIGLSNNAVKLPIAAELSDRGVLWLYDKRRAPGATDLKLTHLIELFGADLAPTLPPPLRTILSLELSHLEFSPTAGLSPRLYPFISATVKTTHPWNITDDFALEEFDLTVTVSDPLSASRQFWFEIEGDCQIEGKTTKLIVSGPEGSNRWRLRVEPGLELQVSKLNGFIGDSTSPGLPTPSQPAATIQLEYLELVADLGGEQSGLQSAAAVVSEKGPWQIIPNKVELDQASISVDIASPTDSANRQINGTASALFKVGSGKDRVEIDLFAQYQQ